jgi:CRP-like cAMP-binding protein
MESTELRSLPLFDGLDDAVVEQCAAKFQETEMLMGSVLAREGEFAYKFFVVLDGEVEVQRDFQHLARLGPGDFFGEMGVVDGGRRNARVLAHTRCRVAWMMGWDFEAMTSEHPQVAERIQAVIDARAASLPHDD